MGRNWSCASTLSAILILQIYFFVGGEVPALRVDGMPTRIQWSPCSVTLKDVSQSYPDSLWRKLTSSVPRRTYAVENISLVFEPGTMSLLVGESSSGKSTVLRLVLGSEHPISGEVVLLSVGNNSNNNDDDANLPLARPVYLDTRPLFGHNDVVEDIWKQSIVSSSISYPEETRRAIMSCLSEVLKLPLQAKIVELSMSDVYTCRLGVACLQSMLLTENGDQPDHRKKDESVEDEAVSMYTNPSSNSPPFPLVEIPGPVLLLDEWLDNESGVVVQNVQSSLRDLVRTTGAVVVCVTHKPQLFFHKNGVGEDGNDDNQPWWRTITLRRGKVVSTTFM